MYCPVHKTKMTELFTSWACDACSPAAAEVVPAKQPTPNVKLIDCTFAYQYGYYTHKVDTRDCIGAFAGEVKCIRCPHKAACLQKTADAVC